MKVDILIFKLEKNTIDRRDIPKLRGYIANKYPNYVDLHNHTEKDGFRYGYPMFQYKVINSTPVLIAINEVSQLLMKVSFDLNEININDKKINISEKGYILKKEKFGVSKEVVKYRFISPWMALNQDNYKKYMSLNINEKNDLLKKILIGNILSISKSLSYSVEEELKNEIDLETLTVNFKNQAMLAFKGMFSINFYIPDYLGLGKSVSRGFGTIKRI